MDGPDFIQDVIYGLKIDQGSPIVFIKVSNIVVDQKTGIKTRDLTSYPINKAVLLPENQRLQFLRSNNTTQQSKQGGIQVRGRQCLIDKRDLPVSIDNINSYVQYGGRYYSVLSVDDYRFAYDITISNVNTMAP